MKRYHVGGSVGLVIFMIVWIPLVLMIMIPGVLSVLFDAPVYFSIIFMLVGLFMLGFGTFMLITQISGIHRKKKALSGRKSQGKVVNQYVKNGKYATNIVEVKYKTESGENAILVTNIDGRDVIHFKVGNIIPIYVSGEYAYFNIDEIRYSNNNIFDEQ